MVATYNLHKLNGLVVKDMATLVQLKYEISPYLASLFKEAIRDEKEKFKLHFSQTVTQFENDTQIRQYISQNQQSLIDLASHLAAYADPQKINSKASAIDCSILCQFIYSSIEELLSFVTKHYPKHAYSDAFVPQNYRMIILSDIRSSKHLLETSLANLNIDKRITQFALQPFEDFLDASVKDFAYRNVIYLKELREELNDLIFQNANFDLNLSDAIQWKLVQLNYNSLVYFKFFTEQITATLNGEEGIVNKLNSLRLMKKRICQLQAKPHIAYDPTMKPIKDVLSDWLDQEINYLQIAPQQTFEPVPHPQSDGLFKVRIDLSVAQIAYFLRVLIEVEIIQSETVAKLINLLPKFIRTTKMENVSPDSFRNRYYAPEAGAKDAVKKILSRMLDYINSNPGIR